MARMKLWKIDDGAIHTVVAEDEADAMAEYIRVAIVRAGCDFPVERPSIEAMDGNREYTLAIDGGQRKITLLVSEWESLYDKPHYLGCSEW